ncbi:hypothetical protein [Raineyella fluvialis]|uniref:Uncharacterized protein n=1 Tax=Raineyella fluvialis TaxID=2662261 RepID=A0A5Q2FDL3_9ACTN|nr:hypothetical protein [Raineyella fluvialis]QGF23877.1 hypothetical protein Rai3103_09530 [Raineyella fluvialis]
MVQSRGVAERRPGTETDHTLPAGLEQPVQEVAHLSGPHQDIDVGANPSFPRQGRIDRVSLDVQDVDAGHVGDALDGGVTELHDGRQRRLWGASVIAAAYPSVGTPEIGGAAAG